MSTDTATRAPSKGINSPNWLLRRIDDEAVHMPDDGSYDYVPHIAQVAATKRGKDAPTANDTLVCTDQVNALEEAGLVVLHPDGDVTLTDSGRERIANKTPKRACRTGLATTPVFQAA
jgi:hypothetical protein